MAGVIALISIVPNDGVAQAVPQGEAMKEAGPGRYSVWGDEGFLWGLCTLLRTWFDMDHLS